jgi:hypothetical protein
MNLELIDKLNTQNTTKVELNQIKPAVKNETFLLTDGIALAKHLTSKTRLKSLRIVELIVEEDVVFYLIITLN